MWLLGKMNQKVSA